MVTDAEDPEAVPIKPAATVIPLRDSDRGPEVLVLRRDTNLAFHGGSWVFPGGRVDANEIEAAAGDDLVAARLAAVREAEEEAGLQLEPDRLVTLSHWTTPVGRNRRFATWFFAAAAPAGTVVIDEESAFQAWLQEQPTFAQSMARAGHGTGDEFELVERHHSEAEPAESVTAR